MNGDALNDFLKRHGKATFLVYDASSRQLLRAEYRRNVLCETPWAIFGEKHKDCDYFTNHDQVAVYDFRVAAQDQKERGA